jgi:hypothetical protein
MRAAIYARVSTFEQEPENQLAELRRYVAARGWTHATEYVDRGVSGAKDTVDFEKWAAEERHRETMIEGVPLTQHWLIPEHQRPRLYAAHPTMSLEEIRVGTQRAWDRFYGWRYVWARSRVVESVRARITFVLISKLYRQMYANTGIATDSAWVQRSARWARWIG